MSIPLIVTAGFGNGTLSGSIIGVTLRGYDIGEEIPNVRMRGQNHILMPTQNRAMVMPNQNRAIIIPPNRRKVKP